MGCGCGKGSGAAQQPGSQRSFPPQQRETPHNERAVVDASSFWNGLPPADQPPAEDK